MEHMGQNFQSSSLAIERDDENMNVDTSDHEEMNHTGIGDSFSDTNSDDGEQAVSDSESCTGACGASSPGPFQFLSGNGMIRLEEGDREHNILKQRFISGMGFFEKHTTVVAIHKNSHSSRMGQTQLQSFHLFAQAMTKKRNGDANIKYAWYSPSKDEIYSIISHGFGQPGSSSNSKMHGIGICLFSEDSSIDCAISSVLDESGLRHVLFCRVILGNMEVIETGSEQFHPSSEQFDSGVDSLSCPKKFFVWSTHLNTHILPMYVLSFRGPPCLKGFQRMHDPVPKPKSPWMPFPALISKLSRFLPPSAVGLISKYESDYREKKIVRSHLVQVVRQIAGDKLLAEIIESCSSKEGGRGVNALDLQDNPNVR